MSDAITDIVTRAPVNRLAATVVSRGEHFDPKKKILTDDSATPLPTRPIPPDTRKSATCVDLTGVRFARFTVLGLSAAKKKMWVVRCACGTYTTRSAKAIRNPENTLDRCETCRYVYYLKRNELWRRTGKREGVIE